MEQLPKLVAGTEIGKKVKLGLIREGKSLEVDVTVGELKEEKREARETPETEKTYGLVVQNITPEIARHLNLKDRRGVIVTDIQPGSPAESADLRAGDIIVEINKKPVRNVADFKELMKKGSLKDGIVVLVKRENVTFYGVMKE
jgi:serine protease Do